MKLISTCSGLVLGTLLFSLLGCQHLRAPNTLPALPLLAPSSSGLEMQVNQELELSARGENHHLLTALLLGRDKVLITGVSASGQRLLTLSYNGSVLKSEVSPAVTNDVPSALILGLVQLTYWPDRALKEAYDAPLTLQSDALQRRVYLEHRPLITVTYNPPNSPTATARASAADSQWRPIAGEKITIEHHGVGLQLVIRTLQVPTKEGFQQ